MATILEDYVSFETAKLLKKKGFDIPLMTVYSSYGEPKIAIGANWNDKLLSESNYCLRPTVQMAMKWLREVHKIIITIDYNDDDDCEENERWGYSVFNPYRKVDHATYVTYEEAAEAAIKYCLKNLI